MGGHKKIIASEGPLPQDTHLPDSQFISQVHCGLRVSLAQASSASWLSQTNQEDLKKIKDKIITVLEALLLCRGILICLIITALLGGPAHYSHITDDESKIKEIKRLVIGARRKV